MPRSLLTLPLTLMLAASALSAQDVPAPAPQAEPAQTQAPVGQQPAVARKSMRWEQAAGG